MMAENDIPRSVLVLGLARSGEAAALALVARGVRVRAADLNEELDTGRLREAGVEVRLGADDPALLDAWTAAWSDLVRFEIVPLVGSDEASARALGG